MEEKNTAKLTPVFKMLEIAIKLWWKNLRKFVAIYVWGFIYALIPLAVIMLLVVVHTTSIGSNIVVQALSVFLGLWSILFIIYFFLRTYITMFLLVKEDFVGEEKKLFKESANYFWSYFTLAILSLTLLALWFLALVIPAVIFSIFYCLAVYAYFFEGKRDIDAIRRSYELVRGNWWSVFGRIFILGAALWAFIFIISLPLNFVASDGVFYSIWGGLVQIVNMLIGPIALLFTYNLFKDLVKNKA
jgi:hypothetical protein